MNDQRQISDAASHLIAELERKYCWWKAIADEPRSGVRHHRSSHEF
jgi:hypothetical protein